MAQDKPETDNPVSEGYYQLVDGYPGKAGSVRVQLGMNASLNFQFKNRTRT